MVCIIHGFPNAVSALRFEWAWQNPSKSKRLREIDAKKEKRCSPFQHQLKIACYMLNSDPWRRLSLTFRWLIPVFFLIFFVQFVYISNFFRNLKFLFQQIFFHHLMLKLLTELLKKHLLSYHKNSMNIRLLKIVIYVQKKLCRFKKIFFLCELT